MPDSFNSKKCYYYSEKKNLYMGKFIIFTWGVKKIGYYIAS